MAVVVQQRKATTHLETYLYRLLVALIRRSDEVVVRDIHELQKLPKVH